MTISLASKYRGYQLSVGHGSVDNVVRPTNADHIVRQCLDVETLPGRPAGDEQLGPHTRRIWKGANGETQLEACSIAGMALGVPLVTVNASGITGPFFLEAGL